MCQVGARWLTAETGINGGLFNDLNKGVNRVLKEILRVN